LRIRRISRESTCLDHLFCSATKIEAVLDEGDAESSSGTMTCSVSSV
jgi:hypothetical protein